MTDRCKLCKKDLPEHADSPYCEQCDEMLDRKFDKIEDDVLVYKDLTAEEIDTLRKFDTEDILELYASTYLSFSEAGQITGKEQALLDKMQKVFNLKDQDIQKKIEVLEKMGEEICPACQKPIQKDFNLCPYCGQKIKEDVAPETEKKPQQPPYQEMFGPMLKSPGCLILMGLIVIGIIVYLVFRFTGS